MTNDEADQAVAILRNLEPEEFGYLLELAKREALRRAGMQPEPDELP